MAKSTAQVIQSEPFSVMLKNNIPMKLRLNIQWHWQGVEAAKLWYTLGQKPSTKWATSWLISEAIDDSRNAMAFLNETEAFSPDIREQQLKRLINELGYKSSEKGIIIDRIMWNDIGYPQYMEQIVNDGLQHNETNKMIRQKLKTLGNSLIHQRKFRQEQYDKSLVMFMQRGRDIEQNIENSKKQHKAELALLETQLENRVAYLTSLAKALDHPQARLRLELKLAEALKNQHPTPSEKEEN